MRRILTVIIFIIVFTVGAAFSAINTNPVDINYYMGTLTVPLSLIMILSLIIGIILGAIAIFINSLRLRYENRRLNKKIAISDQEINSLRILPIKDLH